MVSQLQRTLAKGALGLISLFAIKWIFFDVKAPTPPGEIAHPALLERITLNTPLHGSGLDPRKYPFLQTRIARDERRDLFDIDIRQGRQDFWDRFQKPFATAPDTLHLDEQVIRGVVDELMSFNGWAAAACTTLMRPFGVNKRNDDYTDLTKNSQLYYFALVVHSADHFLIDQIASIVQLSRRLGPSNIFVSLIDYASTDSTPFICDLTEAMLILLGISFRIRRVPPMTTDPTASYYPLEEAYTRNLALEPLHELEARRGIKFASVVWLKGFTCPNDILEMLRIHSLNRAAMTCSMDWKEHNGFFIYNDRWRTRDLDGNLLRGSKSTSPIDEAPPRDAYSISRYSQHLPFQVFCCESGAHIVDPGQSYYTGLTYHSSVEAGVFNISSAGDGKAPKWSEGPCMDSAQMHFCRDLFMVAAQEGIEVEARKAKEREKSGGDRNLSEEMEEIIAVQAPKYGIPRLEGFRAPASDDTTQFDEEEDVVEEDDDDDAAAAAAAAAQPPVVQEPDLPIAGQDSFPGGAGEDLTPEGQNPPLDPAEWLPVQGQLDGEDGQDLPPPPGAGGLEVEGVGALQKRDGVGLERRAPSRQIPNTAFRPARIIVNPRCVTTYAGVSHTRLALDLFGDGDDKEPEVVQGSKYIIDDWRTAPETFVCQEMRTTGGRGAPKQQRRTGFPIARNLRAGWHPS